MNCEQVRPVLLDYLLEEVSAEQRAEIHRHLEQCAACSEEAGLSRQTLGKLEQGAAFEEIPQRIRLVAEPSSRWAMLWLNPARLAVAVGALACVAVALLALFRTTISYRPGHLEIAFGAASTGAEAAAPATPVAAAEFSVAREEMVRLVAEAVAASEERQQTAAQHLVQTVAQQIQEDRMRDWRDMAENLRVFQAAQVSMWKQQVQSEQYVSALMQRAGLELPVQR
jgi:hypothetical protein